MLSEPLVAGREHGGTSVPNEAFFAALREREFARLDRAGHAYLDYAGAALYGASHACARRAPRDPHLRQPPRRLGAAAREHRRRRGRPRARARLSLGVANNARDVDRALALLDELAGEVERRR